MILVIISKKEVSLERGTHFYGRNTYKSTDLAVVLASVEDKSYLNVGVSHKAVLEFVKQSDELALQRISNNLSEVF